MKILDKIANIALILGVAVFIALVVEDEIAKRKMPDTSPRSLVGTSVSLAGLQLNQARPSLLVAISTTCHFCQDSMPFYKELAAKAQGKVDLVAVLPQPMEEAQAFLKKAEVPTNRVVSTNLSAIGVSGTPTILLVDSRGKVQEEWKGLLTDQRKQQLLTRVLQQ